MGNGGSPSMDDSIQKATIVVTIMVTSLGIYAALCLYLRIREYQEVRVEDFEEKIQIEQIDYLISLLDEQEKILDSDTEVRRDPELFRGQIQQEQHLLDLHYEFSDQLDDLHQMMVGTSNKMFEDMVRVRMKKKA